MSRNQATSNPNPSEIGRPNMPGYGIVSDEQSVNLIPWSWVSAQMSRARNYWIITTRPNGKAHAAPVWGLWIEGKFYFGTGVHSQKSRNLGQNPWLVVHLESGDEVVILEGFAERVRSNELFIELNDAYGEKYGFRPLDQTGGNIPEDPWYLLQPETAFAWRESDFTSSATRYRFSGTSTNLNEEVE